MNLRRILAVSLAGVLSGPGLAVAGPQPQPTPSFSDTKTPIKHLVVIFQENVSFDHYFGTYPHAMNLPGENPFFAQPGTPTIDGLGNALRTHNPNLNPANGLGATNPFRLAPSQASTADQSHSYMPEQQAYDGGAMDLFPEFTGNGGTALTTDNAGPSIFDTKGLVMGYFDGNTVTAFWNYAQHFAMSDNSYDTNFGPSTPGAINVISGQTNGVVDNTLGTGAVVGDGNGGLTDNGDADPAGDVCSTTTGETFSMSPNNKNIGDLLNAADVSWGFFSGGFNLSTANANGTTGCARSTTSAVTGVKKADYIPHHQPFQYYASTRNPTHARPSSVSSIGMPNDPVAHNQYDVTDFFAAISAGNFPAVSYLKAPGYQDGHSAYSDPIDEQTFVVNTINFLMKTKEWKSTAVVILYDDSDGWYDHVSSPNVNGSSTSEDALSGAGLCGTGGPSTALPGVSTLHAQGRCGYGPRQPMLVISPYAKTNFVDHAVTDQSSIPRFIEDNWLGGERIEGSFDAIAGSITHMFDFDKRNDHDGDADDGVLILNPTTGEVEPQFHGFGGFGFGY